MPATRRTRKATQRYDPLVQNQIDLERKQIQKLKTKVEKEARKTKRNSAASSIKPSIKKEEQDSAPLQSTPLQNRPIAPQNLMPEASSSDPQIFFFQDKEGRGLHTLEMEYPPNHAAGGGLVPYEFEDHDFYEKNGDIIIMKKRSIEFTIAKKKEKKGAKFSFKKITFNTNYETTKRTSFKILFTLAPGLTSIHPHVLHKAAFDALTKRCLNLVN